MFRHLRTKLTVLYAGLFGAALIVISIAVYAAISTNARGVVRGELKASGTVFDRVWALRARQLEDGAGLLSRDFGFREAVASRDAATIGSALENLRVRMSLDRAFIVGVDGAVVGIDRAALGGAADEIVRAGEAQDSPQGVLMMGGAPYEAIAAPILSPTLVGWVVFASKLDGREMTALERLSAIPLDAAVLGRGSSGLWTGGPSARAANPSADPKPLSTLIDRALAAHSPEPLDFKAPDGGALTLVKPLKSLSDNAPVVLLLSYPLARALAPYNTLLAMILLTGLGGIALVMAGSWALARTVTRPISALDDAVRRLQRGESATVEVAAADEIRERERRITHLALHDAETDLPNRRALEAQVQAMLDGGAQAVAVAVLGVDRFAHVRGAIGYALTADLMREIGGRLQRLRPGDPLGRLTSADFALAYPVRDRQEAEAIAARLEAGLTAPARLGETAVDVSVTVGLALYPDHADGPSSLIERATIALDQARAARRKLSLFDADAYGDPAAKLSLMSEMLSAIKTNQIAIHLQPKYDLRKGRVTAAEALVRWFHPVRGRVMPDDFIPLAEETGHIRALTEHVLTLSVDAQALLAGRGHPLSIAVNISGRLLGDADFAETALEITRSAVGEIYFEITETAVIENPDLALRIIDDFAAAGLKISIDDYGSGLSSLAYLKQIRAHELKIDKAFVMGMADSQRDALLVRSTIDLAHSLGLRITAEGVETATAQALLAGMGCDMAQGYLIAKPMPLEALIAFMDQQATPGETVPLSPHAVRV